MHTVKSTNYSLFNGFVHLGAGLACGITGIAAGYAIGFVGDAVRPAQYTLTSFLRLILTGRTGLRARIQDVRDDGANSHIRRSVGSLWVRRLVVYILLSLTKTHCSA